MKLNFLIGLFILVISLASISAVYNGTINMDIGNGVGFNIGEPLYFTVGNIPATCTTGQTACVGTNYYLCVNNLWVNQGNVDGQCGYSPGSPGGNPSGGGGGGGNIWTNPEFLSSNEGTDNSNNNNQTPKGNEEKEEETGSVTGIGSVIKGFTDFAKSTPGIMSITFISVVFSAVVVTVFKSKMKTFKGKEKNTSETAKSSNSK